MPQDSHVQRDGQMFWLGILMLCLAMIAGMAINAFGQCENGQCGPTWSGQRQADGTPINARCPGGSRAILNPVRPQSAHPAVCQIHIRNGRNGFKGSGVLIWKGEKKAAVLSVGHLFRERPDRVVIIFPNGQQFNPKRIHVDQDLDLGILTIPVPEGIEPMPISEAAPAKVGDRVTICGFDGKTGKYFATPGAVLGYGRHELSDGRFSKATDLLTHGTAQPGMSGGPVVNAAGKLVAVIWGSADGMTHGSYAATICQFTGGDRFIPPWGETDKLTPWNAKTEREKIKAAAGAYAPPPLPLPVAPALVGPPIAIGEVVDVTARGMAQDALQRIETVEQFTNQTLGELKDSSKQLGVDMKDSMGSLTTKTQAALDQTERTAGGLDGLKTGLLSTLKAYVFKMVGSFGLGGGLLATGVAGILFFLLRRQAIRIAQVIDKITDIIPGKLDDRLLDPLAYKLAGLVSGKQVPDYANKPGFDPWGRPLPGQAPPPPPDRPTPPTETTIAVLQAQIDALKSSKG